jgi:hypothetical protein
VQQIRVEGFDPMRPGLAFPNQFHGPGIVVDLPVIGRIPIGDASRGLCGGMVFVVDDLFHHHLPAWPDAQPPPSGSPLFKYIVRRLIDSWDLPMGPTRYASGMRQPDQALLARTVTHVSPIKEQLSAGRPVPLGLVTERWSPSLSSSLLRNPSTTLKQMSRNHQVLAYAYEGTPYEWDRLWIYDPNLPGRSDLFIDLRWEATRPTAIESNASHPRVRGYFPVEYQPQDPRSHLGPSW